MVGILGLQGTHQDLEIRKTPQIPEASVLQEKCQHANPLLTLRSSHSKATSRRSNSAKMQAI